MPAGHSVGGGGGGGGRQQPQGVWMGREVNLRRQHGAARVHLEVARPASEGEPFAGLATNIAPQPRNPAFGCMRQNLLGLEFGIGGGDVASAYLTWV